MANPDLPGLRRNGHRPVQRALYPPLTDPLVEVDPDLVVETHKNGEGIGKRLHHLWACQIPWTPGGATLIGAGPNRTKSHHPQDIPGSPRRPGSCSTHHPESRPRLEGFNCFLVRSKGRELPSQLVQLLLEAAQLVALPVHDVRRSALQESFIRQLRTRAYDLAVQPIDLFL